MTISKSLRVALIVTLVATLLSFAKFNHCRNSGWGSPDVYIHMCYSDISALYGAREINTDKWPYASQSVILTSQTIRLVVGFSNKGPFNTPVYIPDPTTMISIFGDIDRSLENKGSFQF